MAEKNEAVHESSDSESGEEEINYSIPLVQPPSDNKQPPEGTIIFLHGAGDSGPNLKHWIRFRLGKFLKFPHLKIVYPTASQILYSPCHEKAQVWFDFPKGIIFNDPEDTEGIESRAKEIATLIEGEIQNGVSPENIILGGLSQGGIMSLHVGLQFCSHLKLGGIFALSSYLPENSSLYSYLRSEPVTATPVYLANGTMDHLIKFDWGRDSSSKLQSLGVDVLFQSYSGLGHDMCKEELQHLREWILSRIPHSKQR